jgi:protein TonB
MNRFEKKCFIGSAALHGLLLVVFLFGAAFLPSKKPEKMPPVITFYDATMTDRLIASGGNPNGNPEPPAPARQPVKVEAPQPQPPQPPKPEPVKPKEPDQVKVVEPRKDVKLVEKKEKGEVPVQPPKKQPDKKLTETAIAKPRVNTTLTRRTNDLARLERERADKEARDRKDREEMARYNAERQRIAAQVGGIIGGVGKSLSKSTVAMPIGPGAEAYVNYASLVGETYKRAVYAEHPQSDEDVEALIRVVVSRDGSVRNSQWVRRTGNPVLNKAVERAMNRVRSLPEFPPEAKDSERSFNITIAFEAKRVSA